MNNIYEGVTDLRIQSRINEPGINFSFGFSSGEEPSTLRAGNMIEIILDDPDTIGDALLFTGKIETTELSKTSDEKTHDITGYTRGYMLLKQDYYLEPSGVDNKGTVTYRTPEVILANILQETGIHMDRSNPTLKKIKLSNSYLGGNKGWYCGYFDNKKKAIDRLFEVYGATVGKKVKWYMGFDGTLKWFYLYEGRGRVLEVGDDHPQLIDYRLKEDSSNIVNDIEGTAGENSEIYLHLRDTESYNKYGLRVGDPINDTSLKTSNALETRLLEELRQKSIPVYTGTATFKGLFQVEAGRQIQFPDSQNYGSQILTVVDCTITGNPGKQTTTLNLSSDESAISQTNTFDVIKSIIETITPTPRLTRVLEVDGDKVICLLEGTQKKIIAHKV